MQGYLRMAKLSLGDERAMKITVNIDSKNVF